MKKLTILMVLFMLTAGYTVNAQEIVNSNGFNRFLYPNGKVSSEGLMKNGKPDGFWITYYPTGIIKSMGNRRNHLLDSTWVFFNEAGDTLQKINYVMGKKNGYAYEYNTGKTDDPMKRGTIVSKELYVNDLKEGISYYYYPDGKIREKVNYLGNKRNGLTYEYDRVGTIITLLTYKNGMIIERERINRKDNNGLKQGIWRVYADNGLLQKEESFKDDVLHGSYKEYDTKGNITMIMQYVQGNIYEEKEADSLDIEIRNEYDNQGNLIFSGSYKDNIPVGIHRMYDPDGKVTNAFIYDQNGNKSGEGIITNEGKKEGLWKYFNSDGSIRATGRYANNLATGKWQYYYEKGTKEQEGSFENGKPVGLWQWFYSDGSIKREEEFYAGKPEGLYMEYDTLGNVIVNGKYFDGQKEEEWFYTIGDYTEKGKYVADLKDGKWQAFYSDGKLKYEGNFIQGNPDGEHRFYYPNGQLKEVQYYIMGISEKNWRKYDENGQLLLTITYKNNREVRINGEKIGFEENDIKLIQ